MVRNQRDESVKDFTVTNWNEDVALDCDAAADAEICDVLGTVIKALQDHGILGGTTST